MSAIAFVGFLVGAILAAAFLARLSFWLGVLSVIVGAAVLVLAWKELSGMRRLACSVALGWFILCWIGYTAENDRIAAVKSMACPASPTHTIGRVLDTVCKNPRWECFENEDGFHTVKFTGKTKQGVLMMQFGIIDNEPIEKSPYAELNGDKLSMFEVANFFSQADAEYSRKKGE